MSAFQLQWSIEGKNELSRIFGFRKDKLVNFGPAFQRTAETLKSIFTNDVFRTQGAILNERWSPLSKAYALQKAKKYPGKGTLEASGRMRNSFETEWNSGLAAVGNSAPYFKYHQSDKPRSVLPRRVMMKLGTSQKEIVIKIFHEFWQKQ